MSNFGTWDGQMAALLATMRCLSETAAERGDLQAGSVLHNAAALLEIALTETGLTREQSDYQLRHHLGGADHVVQAHA